jgi:hypothetical protein
MFLLFSSLINAKTVTLSQDILADGRWCNDEYDLVFTGEGIYRSNYTSGGHNGRMSFHGTISGEEVLELKSFHTMGDYDSGILTDNSIRLFLVSDPGNPKATRILRNESGSFILWNEKYLQKAGAAITLGPENTPCVTLGNVLSTTTDNVRIRKGPGTNHQFMDFRYMDTATGKTITHPAIISGTNIRVLARTVDRMKVGKWDNHWYYVEYREPEAGLLAYKNAWMFGEFIYMQNDPGREITITSCRNEEAIYSVSDMDISGRVTGNPERMRVQIKNSYGNIKFEEPVKNYDRKNGTFSYTISKNRKTLFIGSNIYNFVAEYSDGKKVPRQLTLFFHEPEGEMAKPVIYLYPTETTSISVNVTPVNGISKSDPPYGSGWRITAKPSGEIRDHDGRAYDFLYWESPDYPSQERKTGFMVKTENLSGFFREKLAILGLNSREISDFLEFWIPLMNRGGLLSHLFSGQGGD